MDSLKLRYRVGSDGVLRLEVPVGFRDRELEVMVIVQPLLATAESARGGGWPEGFLQETFGCLRDDPLVRPPQGEYETRDILR